VRTLDHDERVEELARMLGGARVTDTARSHAQQLIAEARSAREALKPKGTKRTRSARA
jgi:DNA repair protein RecN (Recombination protein N)